MFETLRALWTQHLWCRAAGEHLGQGLPQPHRAVADHQLGVALATSAAVAQQVGPRLRRLAQALYASATSSLVPSSRTPAHQHTGVGLSEPDLGVHAVGPHVDEVAPERSRSWKAAWSWPHCFVSRVTVAASPGRRAEELLQRGHEVSRGQSVQVEQRKYLAHLRRLAAPRGQDLRGEPLALPGRFVHAPVVHPGRGRLDRAGRSDHGAGPVAAVAHHQRVPELITLGSQLGYVLVDFRLQRGGEHPPGALADDLIDHGAGLGGTLGIHYAEHGRAFPTRAANAGLLGDHHRIIREGTPSAYPRG